MKYPSFLKKGDTIGVIAPSNSIDIDDNEFIQNSSKLFEDLGFNIKLGKFVFIIYLILSWNPYIIIGIFILK